MNKNDDLGHNTRLPRPTRREHFYNLSVAVSRTVMRLAGGYHVFGIENIPASGGALICPNHISYLDPPAVSSGLPRRTFFMAKQELFQVPVLASIIRKLHSFPVDREVVDRETIRKAIGILEHGDLLIVFPEGKRSPDGALHPASSGPALIAARAGVPIVPASVKETDKVMPSGKAGLHRGRVQVDYGTPIHPHQFGTGRLDKAQLQEFMEAVMQAIADLQKTQYQRVGETPPPRVKESKDAQ